ncbi:hypothetical protein ACIP6I_28970 [Streptomyces anulatus]
MRMSTDNLIETVGGVSPAETGGSVEGVDVKSMLVSGNADRFGHGYLGE